MAELTGQTFAGYEIISKLGQGGMGAVYKARQPMLNRIVALKVMAPQLSGDEMFVARFAREATTAAQLNHVNMVQVFTAGQADGAYYIVMEFVDGESLRDHIVAQGRLDAREAVAVTVYVAQALQYAWNKAQLIHRDIKPDNIFLSKTGEVKVGDLGLAKNVGQSTAGMTATGMAMGSPHYIAPEQARGVKDIDFRADIYSLGCTLYHMLTGRTPYDGEDSMAIMMKHVNDPPPAVFKAWPQCPMPLGMLVGKMLSKRRQQRPQSYEELIEELLAIHDKLKADSERRKAEAEKPTVPAQPTPKAPAPAAKAARIPTPTMPVARKKISPAMIYGAAGAAGALLVTGLLIWSPWSKSPSQDSNTPSLQHSAASALAPKPPPANPKPGDTMVTSAGIEMVYIPPGEFLMGSTEAERQWAVNYGHKLEPFLESGEPKRTKIKNGFWMGRTEVTVGQWRRFVKATGYSTEAEKKGYVDCAQNPKGGTWTKVEGKSWRDPGFDFPIEENHPACCISWNDAVAFCKWLTESEREAGRLSTGKVYRLPAEAEWEYACRGGKEGAWFWWGNEVKEGNGRFNGPSISSSPWTDDYRFASPVDAFGKQGRNGFGLADMLGNAQEWCLDACDTKQAHEEPYKWSNARVLRGGAFYGYSRYIRCASRDRRDPSETAAMRGFRVCAGVNYDRSGSSTVPSSAGATPGHGTGPTTAHPVNEVFIREVAVLPAEQQVQRVMAKLKELNPGFDGKETHKIKDGEVTVLEFLTEAVTDISPVRALKALQELNCGGSYSPPGLLADLTPLRGMALRSFLIVRTKVADLSPLKGMPLQLLSCGGTRITDLSPLQDMPLRSLSIGSTKVQDLSPLKGMALTSLTCYSTQVTDLSVLRGVPLKSLIFDFIAARDIEILRSFKSLEQINYLPAAEFWTRVAAGEIPKAIPPRLSTSQTAAAALKQLGNVFTNSVGGEMVYIPPGEFMLGSTKEEQAWALANGRREENVKDEGEAPRKARIKQSFWMGRTEVTVGQWKEFVAATGYKTDAEKKGYVSYGSGIKIDSMKDGMSWRDPNFGFEPTTKHPVSCISWNDAKAFCEWLDGREHTAGRLSAGYKVRLPTEAEWEYACRAGTQTRFWWGDTENDYHRRLNWGGKGDGFEFVSPVDHYGKRGRNAFGLADMAGNVREWCLDEYEPTGAHEECYKGDPEKRVLRGGGFEAGTYGAIRCAARLSRLRAASLPCYGFRVCVGVDVSGATTAAASTSPAGALKATEVQAPAETRVPAVTANPKRGEVCTLAFGGNATLELVGIPPGEFMMGSTKEEQAWAEANGCKLKYSIYEGEAPRKTAVKQGFWLGRTEVTVGQWKLFVTATGYVTDGEKKGDSILFDREKRNLGQTKGASWKDPGFGFKLKDDHSVSCISWNDAVAFCEWLNEREVKAGRLPPGFKVRLPTEAEWEYACRAGKDTKFWWGETQEGGENRLNWSGTADGFESVSPVDHYNARGRNKHGLADMLGNVREWCLDEFDPAGAHEEPYKGNPSGRVARGSSFYFGPAFARCAYRETPSPSRSGCDFGFRVAVGPAR